MRRWWVGLTAGVLAGVLVGCGSTPTDTQRPKDQIVLGMSSAPDTLNPVLGYAAEGASKIFDGLVAYDDKLQLVPALAESLPTISDDGRSITYTLRPDVVFHDGSALSADDVVFTYRALLDPKTDSTLRASFDAVAEVSASDARTVVFRLKYPYVPFVKRTTLGIVPAKLLTGTDINTAAFNRKPVGTGPYKVESFSEEKLTLVANEAYWGKAPAIKRVTMAFIGDDSVRAARLRSGELDGAVLPAKIADSLGDLPGYRRWDNSSADYRVISVPMQHPVLGDPAVRRALDHAVDRQAMLTALMNGQGKPAFGLVSPDAETWFDPELNRPATPDTAAAERELEAAGWVVDNDGIRTRNGEPASFTLMYPAGDSLRKDLATAVASDARKIGLDVQLAGLDWSAITPRLGKDAIIYAGGAPYDPDFDLYDALHSSRVGKGWANPGRYANPAVDDLLEQARRSGDDRERSNLYRQIQQQTATDVPNIGLVFLNHTYLVRDRWTGQAPRTEPHDHGFNGIWWNLEDWTPRP
ncbi:MAG TPA: ABC transporter substrate-binding protein [Micromonospora sp.]|nr:ABC transporter substrate-binding protein [Micromonospora sp.]